MTRSLANDRGTIRGLWTIGIEMPVNKNRASIFILKALDGDDGCRAHQTLVILAVAGGLWMTEALPVAVTALLIPVLGIGLGVMDARTAFAGFGDPIVFLFFGTFLLTDAAALGDRVPRLRHLGLDEQHRDHRASAAAGAHRRSPRFAPLAVLSTVLTAL